jgi:AcrR family transcriptional regulator
MTGTAADIGTAVTRAPGRPRDPEVDRAILEATIDLLVDAGFGRLSIEAVAERAEVGKTTIYRRWPSKIPLVVDALRHLKNPTALEIADEMTTHDAFVLVLSQLVRTHHNDANDQMLAGLIDAMSRDPELAAAVRAGLVSDRRKVMVGLVERGIARGELRADVDPEVIADLLGGAIVMRKMITGAPVTPRLVRQVVTLVLDGAAPSPRR